MPEHRTTIKKRTLKDMTRDRQRAEFQLLVCALDHNAREIAAAAERNQRITERLRVLRETLSKP